MRRSSRDRRRALHERRGPGDRARVRDGARRALRHARASLRPQRQRGEGDRLPRAAPASVRWHGPRTPRPSATSRPRLQLACVRPPQSPERDRRELVLQARLGTVLVATRGYAAPAAARAYARAEALCEHVGEAPELPASSMVSPACPSSRESSSGPRSSPATCSNGARRPETRRLVMEARRLLGEIRFWHGEPYRAKRHLDDVVRVYDGERHRAHALRYGDDPSVVAQGYLAVTAWISGRPTRPAACDALLAFARDRAHPFSLSVAWLFACLGRSASPRAGRRRARRPRR